MTEAKEKLDSRSEFLGAEVLRLDREIAERIADGSEETGLIEKLRAKRRNILEERSDLDGALALVREREAGKAQAVQERNLREAQTKVRHDSQKLLEAASEVDMALDALEAAHGQLRLAALDLSRSMRLAGTSDGGRLSYSLGPAIRWASWSQSPGAAEDMQVPRAPGNRRRPLRDSAERLIPSIGH